jgi:predicted SnoaL-like aldol condensation-catalyzing enzyme
MPRTEVEERNRQIVLEMFEKVLIPMDSSQVDRFIAPDYLQHSSLAEPGVEGLKRWLDHVRVETPDAWQEVKRSFADGDYVITHQHVVPRPGDLGFAVMDIFRLENGLIVEHWDVVQELTPNPPNPNSMF